MGEKIIGDVLGAIKYRVWGAFYNETP